MRIFCHVPHCTYAVHVCICELCLRWVSKFKCLQFAIECYSFVSHPTSTMNMTALQHVNNLTLCRMLVWLILSCFIMCTVSSQYMCTVFFILLLNKLFKPLSISGFCDYVFLSPPTQSKYTEM